MLDEVCDRIREIKAGGKTRPDASLGIIKSQKVADRLKEAGLECYGHNLESSRRFFAQHCTTHTFEDRLGTIQHLKNAGIKICSGGIIGMGETREDRCDLAFELKAIGANVVPVNILNPIPGTPFANNPPLPVLEILKTIACFRFILPRQEIMIAGGRTVNLRDAQSMIFMAGASALMVGNYLTTLNQPVEKDLQMLKDLGLDPSWDNHGFADQEENGCGCSTESWGGRNCLSEVNSSPIPTGLESIRPGNGASSVIRRDCIFSWMISYKIWQDLCYVLDGSIIPATHF